MKYEMHVSGVIIIEGSKIMNYMTDCTTSIYYIIYLQYFKHIQFISICF